LDQAFTIEQSGSDLILRYAIATSVRSSPEGGPDRHRGWKRGETIYMPDGKISLYPTSLCEGRREPAARRRKPAIVFTVRVTSDGAASLDGAERAMIRSSAKLGYATVRPEDLPAGFDEFARRIEAAEDARGASRVDPPQQQVVEGPDGCFCLEFRPMSAAEQSNACLSLAANLAIADALFAHGTGLFRVMAGSRTTGLSGVYATARRRSASTGRRR
jgi:exoribonuclease R